MYIFTIKDGESTLAVTHEKFITYSVGGNKWLLCVATFFKNGGWVKQFEIYSSNENIQNMTWSQIQSRINNKTVIHRKTYVKEASLTKSSDGGKLVIDVEKL
jgi:ribosomal protein S8